MRWRAWRNGYRPSTGSSAESGGCWPTRSHESGAGRPSPGAGLSALYGSRQGFQDPLAAPLLTHINLARVESLHGQSFLELLRTRPLTAPAPGSDRRLSGEGHQVGGHQHGPGGPDDHQAQPAGMDSSQRSCALRPLPPARDHAVTAGQALSLDLRHGVGRRAPGPRARQGRIRQVRCVQGRRPGARSRMHLQRDRAHLHAYDLHRVRRVWAGIAQLKTGAVPWRGVQHPDRATDTENAATHKHSGPDRRHRADHVYSAQDDEDHHLVVVVGAIADVDRWHSRGAYLRWLARPAVSLESSQVNAHASGPVMALGPDPTAALERPGIPRSTRAKRRTLAVASPRSQRQTRYPLRGHNTLTRKRSPDRPAVPHPCHARQRPAVSHGHSPALFAR